MISLYCHCPTSNTQNWQTLVKQVSITQLTEIGTVERRLSGCVVDQGQVPPKDESQEMIELLYFLSYMSNGMPVDGPDVR